MNIDREELLKSVLLESDEIVTLAEEHAKNWISHPSMERYSYLVANGFKAGAREINEIIEKRINKFFENNG